MISRYETTAMKEVWNQNKRFQLWLDFQILVCEAWTKLKLIPEDEYQKIVINAKLDLKLMAELEQKVKHDVVAFTTMLASSMGFESRWIHYGLTSTDMVDSVQNYQIKMANQIISQKISQLQKILKTKADYYKNQIIIGRTHGIFAEPTSLGLKFALWYKEIARQKVRLQLAAEQIEVIKVTGSVGNFAHVMPEISQTIANKWKMAVDNCATQVVQRDRHYFLLSTLANLATSIEKIALEIRLSQRSEVNELSEGFSEQQKGSSSMPHKKNPIGCENICGLARLLRGYSNVSAENNLLWYERDISHSSNERVILPDVYHTLDFICERMIDILNNLHVNEAAMAENLLKAKNSYFSQPVLLAIIKHNPHLSREQAYDYVQKCTLQAQQTNRDLIEVFAENHIKQYLDQKTLNDCYNINNFLKNIDFIYQQVFQKVE